MSDHQDTIAIDINAKEDKVQLYNFKNNQKQSHSNVHISANSGASHQLKNGLNSKSIVKTPKGGQNKRNPALTASERETINIDSICSLNWMLVIILFTLINLYLLGYVETRCKEYKSKMIMYSHLISSLTAIETTAFYLIWFFLTKSRYYHMQIIYDSITAIHILIAILNILFATTTFLTRTCHEKKLTVGIDLNSVDPLHLFALKYDLKLAGLGHILLTVIVAISAVHLTTKRSRYFLHFLTKRGLLIEYIWLFD